MKSDSLKPTFVVTVTYGKRASLLSKALVSAFREGVDRAIVVDNGSEDNILDLLHERFPKQILALPMGRNTGSACGFSEGLKAAYHAGAEFVLLLDDDNVLEPGALEQLKKGWTHHANETPEADLVVLGFRPEHQADVAEGFSSDRINQNSDSFFGFQLIDIPFKLWRRTPWFRRKQRYSLIADEVPLTVAPYSGMFFHRKLLTKHGFPNPNFVLYVDDTEFSYRVTKSGGKIFLLTKAQMTDLESSWNVRKRFNSSFDTFLNGVGERRVYYGVRNQAYFERYCRTHNILLRSINRFVYLILLTYFAYRYGKQDRLQLIKKAISDGEQGSLGENPAYPL